MKIVIATGLYPPEIGGPATYTVLLEKELPKLGYSIEVLPFSRSRHLPKVIRHLHYFFLLYKLAYRSDVIFSQDVASVALPALFVAKLSRKKFFVRVPGDYAWEQSTQRYGVKDSIDSFQNKHYGLRVTFLRFIQKSVTRFADVVLTPSDYFNALVVGWGVSAEKVHTIYNGVDLSADFLSVEKPGPLVLLSAGRLVPWKGFDKVIELMCQLPAWHLVILGDGPEKEKLEELVQKFSLKNRVHFMGAVSRPEVFGWCRASDAFILNTYFESFSYQIVEAMYSGIPVITTNVGSIPELISSGVEGELFEPDDTQGFLGAIESVLKQKGEWSTKTRQAQMKARKFSIQSTIHELDKILKEETKSEVVVKKK